MNKQRFLKSLDELGRIGWQDGKGLYRMAFSEAFLAGRDYVANLMTEAGMSVRVDPVGNIFGRYEGSKPNGKTILTGSHLDSVPGGGIYDGPLGVLSSLEAARSLHEKGLLRNALEVVGFNGEEGGDMGGTFGSRAICGSVKTFPSDDIMSGLGLSRDIIASAKKDLSEYLCYLELHIEQGPVLWRRGIELGIPTAIVGITRYLVTVTGQANHAGTTPMAERRDAVKEAVRLLHKWYDVVDALQAGASDGHKNFVCNVGVIEAVPNSAAVVPGEASFVLELRSTDDSMIGFLKGRFDELLPSVCLPVSTELMVSKPAVILDDKLRGTIRAVCRDNNVKFLDMPSGAGHDASPLAQCLPAAMIFVPSIEGISHSMEENTDPEDMVRGAEILEKTLEKIDREFV